MISRHCLAALLILSAIAQPGLAQQDHADHADHSSHAGPSSSSATNSLPQQGGQAAFAALAEIVALLEADPDTDWSEVNVAALREHLRDMDELMMHAEVETEVIPDGLRMTLTGPARTQEALQRMVPAHAMFLDQRPQWQAATEVDGEIVVLTVTAASDTETLKLRALGFFGLMATENHHQVHHWALVRGEPMH